MSVAALAAAVWTGGHRVLDLGGLPKAQRAREAGAIRAFEERFEPVGLGAMAIQVVSRLWMVEIVLPGVRCLCIPANPIAVLAGVNLLLLAATAALVLHAHLRLIPHLRDTNLSSLAWHICAVTPLEVAFVVVGGDSTGWVWLSEGRRCRPTTNLLERMRS